jgi:Protein of unknown function (DUF3592)
VNPISKVRSCPQKNMAFCFFFGAANFILCTLCVILSLPFFWRQYQILEAWSETDAQVIRSEVVTQEAPPHEQLYAADLQVLYAVNGKPFTAELVSFQSQNYQQTADRAAQFHVGSRHPIRYDPRAPTQARIGAGWNLHFFVVPLVMLGMAAIFGAIAVAFLIAVRYLRLRKTIG